MAECPGELARSLAAYGNSRPGGPAPGLLTRRMDGMPVEPILVVDDDPTCLCIMTDVDLPGEDGYALVRTIRAVEREVGVNVPAVALTASSHADDRERALRAGFQVHLPKVLAPSELAQVVAQLTSAAEGVRGDG